MSTWLSSGCDKVYIASFGTISGITDGFLTFLISVHTFPKTQTFSSKLGVRITYDLWDGAGRGLILVHGLASNAKLFWPLAERLNDLGYRVAAVDQRGHGRSDKPDSGYGFDEVCSDLFDLTENLSAADEGWSNPILIGQSWGASVVLEEARRSSGCYSGVVLIDGGVVPMFRHIATWEECQERLAPPDLLGLSYATFEGFVRSHHPDWSEDAIEGTLANMELQSDGTIRPHLSRSNHMEILKSLWEYDPVDTFSSMKLGSLLLLAASGDEMTDYKGHWAKEIETVKPEIKTVWFEGADHDLHAQYPDRVAMIIDQEIKNGVLK